MTFLGCNEVVLGRALQIALDIVAGLEHLHTLDILHLDLKGKNVLLHGWANLCCCCCC